MIRTASTRLSSSAVFGGRDCELDAQFGHATRRGPLRVGRLVSVVTQSASTGVATVAGRWGLVAVNGDVATLESVDTDGSALTARAPTWSLVVAR